MVKQAMVMGIFKSTCTKRSKQCGNCVDDVKYTFCECERCREDKHIPEQLLQGGFLWV